MGIKRDSSDKWFSDCIRHRANYHCEHCGKYFSGLEQGFHCAHIYGRANKSTRWDVDNAVGLCAHCHRTFSEHPIDFHNWLQEKIGQGMLDLLREKKNTPMKTTKALRLEIAKHYRDQFRAMVDGGHTNLEGF